MLAPFLPGTAESHGLSSTTVGLIFAMHPLGSIATSLMLPWMLRQPWADTFQFIRRATAVNALCVCCIGLLGEIDAKPDDVMNAIAFGLPLMLLRFGQGVCVTFMEVSNETISLKLLPKAYIGPVQGVIMATRTLSVIAGPALGGFLYQAGCWALPFTVGAALLAFATLFLNVVLPGHAPANMRSLKSDASGLEVCPSTLSLRLSPALSLRLSFSLAVSPDLSPDLFARALRPSSHRSPNILPPVSCPLARSRSCSRSRRFGSCASRCSSCA